jgi:uncharacterized protein
MNRPEEIRAALDDTTTWFVVGLRDNPARDAFDVASFLQGRGKRIVPIHPLARSVHGETGYATIADAAAAVGPPDVVDVFVRSGTAGRIADDAIAAGARVVWFQFGVIDDDAAQRVVDAGLTMIMDRCPTIEFARLA